MKKCCKCNELKDENEFPLQRRYTKNKVKQYTVRRSECKPCYNIYMKTYLSDKDSHKKLVKRSKQEKINFVSKIKMENGCSKCGYKKCARALHFHHLNPDDKKFEISWAAFRGVSIAKLENEIKKCVLLCSNCHAEIESNS